MKRILERMARIRALVNSDIQFCDTNQSETEQNRIDWQILCAFMDVIEDTAYALMGYEQDGLGLEWTSQYLRLYGLLNAIYLQQEILGEIYKVLKKPFQKDGAPGSAHSELRITRCDVGAHAISRQCVTSVSRAAISTDRLQLIRWDRTTGKATYPEVELKDLFNRWKDELLSFLDIEPDLRRYTAETASSER